MTLAAPWESRDDLKAQRRLGEAGVDILTAHLDRARVMANLVRAAVSETPLQARYSWSGELARKIEERLEASPTIDVIHLEHLRGACYGLALGASRENGMRPVPPIVWDSVDCISLLFERTVRSSRSRAGRWIARIELPRTRRWEGRLVGRFAGTLATSEDDAQALSLLAERSNPGRRAEVDVLPNGVDLEYFGEGTGLRRPATLVLTGKMSYHANATAAAYLSEEIMPRVWAAMPEVEVILAGKSPPRAVRDLEGIRPGKITVTGTVPDLRPFLHQATVAVVPLVYGAGSQYKVLEAMASGAPVVATTLATSALAARNGDDLLVADGTEAFAESVVRLLQDGELRRRLAANGRRYVERHHDWDQIVAHLEAIYDRSQAT